MGFESLYLIFSLSVRGPKLSPVQIFSRLFELQISKRGQVYSDGSLNDNAPSDSQQFKRNRRKKGSKVIKIEVFVIILQKK